MLMLMLMLEAAAWPGPTFDSVSFCCLQTWELPTARGFVSQLPVPVVVLAMIVNHLPCAAAREEQMHPWEVPCCDDLAVVVVVEARPRRFGGPRGPVVWQWALESQTPIHPVEDLGCCCCCCRCPREPLMAAFVARLD